MTIQETTQAQHATGIDEKAVVRELAMGVAEAARAERMQAIHKRWCDVNSLRTPDRAPVWCRPVGCWKEILPQESLICTDPWLRGMEYQLRQIHHKLEIDDDTPLEPYWTVSPVFHCEPKNIWGIDVSHHASNTAGGAWAYNPPLGDEEDFDQLRLPVFTYDEHATREHVERMEDLLGDILPVRVSCASALGATLGFYAADLRGLTEIMMDMIDEPELMHRLMGHLRDGVLASMDAIEQAGEIRPNNTGAMIKSDPLREPSDGSYSWQDCWCMANSQEFDQVSPAMWEEFCLEYQRPIFERFGAIAYGCCENLTQKIDGVLSIPNLRIFTCSAWTDLDQVLEKVGKKHTIMWRQKASDVVLPKDTASIRAHFEENLQKLQGFHYQIVLRELETLNGHTDRLHVWTDMAKELAAKYA